MSVLAVLEQGAGQWHRMSFETLAAAQQIARELDTTVSAAVLGNDIGALASELAATDVATVYAFEHALLRRHWPRSGHLLESGEAHGRQDMGGE